MPAAVTRKLSRLHKPPDLSLEAWQRELRRQFGRAQPFKLTNAGSEPVFSEFQVSNARSGSTYRFAIRGPHAGDNFQQVAIDRDRLTSMPIGAVPASQ